MSAKATMKLIWGKMINTGGHLREKIFGLFFDNPYIFAIWVIAVGITWWLPLSVAFEFSGHDAAGKVLHRSDLFRFYPHLLLVVPMVFWVPFFTLARAFALLWKWLPSRRTSLIIGCEIVAFLAAIIVFFSQWRGGPTLLTDIRPDQVFRSNGLSGSVTLSVLMTAYRHYLEFRSKIPAELKSTFPENVPARYLAPEGGYPEGSLEQDRAIVGEGIRRTLRRERRTLNEVLKEPLKADFVSSRSRWSNLATVFVSLTCVLGLVMGLTQLPAIKQSGVFKEYGYLLMLTALSLTLWMPARIYYNDEIKVPVFGRDAPNQAVDILLYLLLAGFVIGWVIRCDTSLIEKVIGVAGPLIQGFIGYVTNERLTHLYGLASQPWEWLFTFLLILIYFWVFTALFRPPSDRDQGMSPP